MKDFYDLQNEIISLYDFSADVSFYITCVIYGIIVCVCVFIFLKLFILLIDHIFCSKHYLFLLRPVAFSINSGICLASENQVSDKFLSYSDKELFHEFFYTVRVGQFTKIMFNSVKKKYSKRGLVISKVLKFNSNFDYKQFVYSAGNYLDYTKVYSEFDKLPNGIYK